MYRSLLAIQLALISIGAISEGAYEHCAIDAVGQWVVVEGSPESLNDFKHLQKQNCGTYSSVWFENGNRDYKLCCYQNIEDKCLSYSFTIEFLESGDSFIQQETMEKVCLVETLRR